MKTICISCNKAFDVGYNPHLGESVVCPECGAHLEIVWLDPVEVDWPADFDSIDEDEEEYEVYEDD